MRTSLLATLDVHSLKYLKQTRSVFSIHKYKHCAIAKHCAEDYSPVNRIMPAQKLYILVILLHIFWFVCGILLIKRKQKWKL